jgi:hypothetical protein
MRSHAADPCSILVPAIAGGLSSSCVNPGAFGSVCTMSCPGGLYLQGNYQQTCNNWISQANCTASYSGTLTSTCIDTRTVAQANSVCELATPPESCYACNTLMYEPFGYDTGNASRWSVFDFSGSVNTPGVWSSVAMYNGMNVSTQTNTGVTCGSGANAQPAAVCTATSMLYNGGASWTNYKVRISLAFATLSGSVGVVLYYTTAGYYEYLLSSNGNRMLRKVISGVTTNLWPTVLNMPFVQNAFTNVEVEVRYGKIRVWNEGVAVGFPVYDTTLSGGTVGPSSGAGASLMIAFVMVQQQSAVQLTPPAQCTYKCDSRISRDCVSPLVCISMRLVSHSFHSRCISRSHFSSLLSLSSHP